MKKITNTLLSASLLLTITGCSQSAATDNNSVNSPSDSENTENANYEPIEVKSFEPFYKGCDAFDAPTMEAWESRTQMVSEANSRFQQFAFDLLRKSYTENENEIISPLSLYYALGILANGTGGQTRAEIETVMGMCLEDANRYLYDLANSLKYGERYYTASALWFNNDLGLTLKQDYLSTIQQYYGNSAFEKSFNDPAGIAGEVNNWASQETNGSIDNIVDPSDIKFDTPLLILNALATGAKWEFPFDATKNEMIDFHNHDGSISNTEMMKHTYEGHWWDDKSEGFSAYLENQTEFFAILPNEGIDIYDYIANMDFDTLRNYKYEDAVPFNEATNEVDLHFTNVIFPKFTYDKDYDLNNSLKALGLSELFHKGKVDFSNLVNEDTDELFIEQIKQKDTIYVDEYEVRAAAVTVVHVGKGSDGKVHEIFYHDVVFDRPFIYLIMDGGAPLFIGVVTDMSSVDVPAGSRMLRLKENINVRQYPSTDAYKYDTAEAGTEFAYSESSYDGKYTWYKIVYNGFEAYIADDNGNWVELLN